ncbi:MAG: zinc ribbon domain-containing protein [Chloroflexi bacterium]|nr:zinc ribbon domain-containing protein [Chloroflexota bacterium]
MTRLVFWLLMRLVFQVTWAILRAVGLETYAALRAAAPRVLEAAPRAAEILRPAARLHCGQCGGRVNAASAFCPTCGLAVQLERDGSHMPVMLHTCRTCGAAVDLADRHCTACGNALTALPAGTGPRPAPVEIAAGLHTLSGAAAGIVTLPFAGPLGLALAGNAMAVGFIQGLWFPILLGVVTWGFAWAALSLAMAWGVRSGKPWALHATFAVSLLWSLTAIGAVVGLPLIIALLLPSSQRYFGRGPARSALDPLMGSAMFREHTVVIGGRRG